MLLSAIAGLAQQAECYVADGFKIQQGKEATLSISLRNTIGICGLQMRIYLPEGIAIAEQDLLTETLFRPFLCPRAKPPHTR